MHQRATDIRLMPEIETPCMADLGKLCAENTQEGEVCSDVRYIQKLLF